jgi:hypothetical protein
MKQYNGVDIRDKIIHLVYTTHVFVNPVSENVSDYELKFDFHFRLSISVTENKYTLYMEAFITNVIIVLT